jgi:hypothetical protein
MADGYERVCLRVLAGESAAVDVEDELVASLGSLAAADALAFEPTNGRIASVG